jgi:hypothetical protein
MIHYKKKKGSGKKRMIKLWRNKKEYIKLKWL